MNSTRTRVFRDPQLHPTLTLKLKKKDISLNKDINEIFKKMVKLRVAYESCNDQLSQNIRNWCDEIITLKKSEPLSSNSVLQETIEKIKELFNEILLDSFNEPLNEKVFIDRQLFIWNEKQLKAYMSLRKISPFDQKPMATQPHPFAEHIISWTKEFIAPMDETKSNLPTELPTTELEEDAFLDVYYKMAQEAIVERFKQKASEEANAAYRENLWENSENIKKAYAESAERSEKLKKEWAKEREEEDKAFKARFSNMKYSHQDEYKAWEEKIKKVDERLKKAQAHTSNVHEEVKKEFVTMENLKARLNYLIALCAQLEEDDSCWIF